MDNTYNIDFIARCIAGHNKTDIKSIITELENVQKQIGGVSLVEITQEDYDTLTDKDPSTIYLVSNGDKITLYIGGAEVNEIEGIKVNNTTISPDSNKIVNIIVPTTAADVSALPDTTKYAAALSLTINASTFVMTGQLKDQNGDNLGTAQTIDLPLESVVVDGSYNSQTKKVVLTLQNGNTIEFSVADLVLGLQTELSASNKLNPAYINYDSTHRAVSDTEKSTWNGKQNALSSTQLDAVNSGIDSTKVTQITTNKNNISSLNDEINSTPKVVYKKGLLVSTSTTIAPTGLEYTIPDTSTGIYRISAVASYNASQPDEIRLVQKSTGALYGVAVRNTIATNASVTVTGYVAVGINLTVEVQAKYSVAANNYIWIIVEKIST